MHYLSFVGGLKLLLSSVAGPGRFLALGGWWAKSLVIGRGPIERTYNFVRPEDCLRLRCLSHSLIKQLMKQCLVGLFFALCQLSQIENQFR